MKLLSVWLRNFSFFFPSLSNGCLSTKRFVCFVTIKNNVNTSSGSCFHVRKRQHFTLHSNNFALQFEIRTKLMKLMNDFILVKQMFRGKFVFCNKSLIFWILNNSLEQVYCFTYRLSTFENVFDRIECDSILVISVIRAKSHWKFKRRLCKLQLLYVLKTSSEQSTRIMLTLQSIVNVRKKHYRVWGCDCFLTIICFHCTSQVLFSVHDSRIHIVIWNALSYLVFGIWCLVSSIVKGSLPKYVQLICIQFRNVWNAHLSHVGK